MAHSPASAIRAVHARTVATIRADHRLSASARADALRKADANLADLLRSTRS